MISDEIRKKSRISTNAVEKIYISMRHLFNRGFYKPNGVSGVSLTESLLKLSPEIYGSMSDENKVELNGLTYVVDRLPDGIEQCRYIHFTSDEGFDKTHIEKIIPSKRRRNCYRIDKDQMNIEITRGRSDIYDVLTHITFIYHEANKIMNKAYIKEANKTTRAWNYLEKIATSTEPIHRKEREIGLIHLASILGRTFEETLKAYKQIQTDTDKERFFRIIYWLGKLSMKETLENEKREVSFSSLLQDLVGHHKHGDLWASNIKKKLVKENLIGKDVHIISANMHSVQNVIYAKNILKDANKEFKNFDFYSQLSVNSLWKSQVKEHALENGMFYLKDTSGTNIDTQIIDLSKVSHLGNQVNSFYKKEKAPVIIVMDYAFGEQAFETMDELLKPYSNGKKEIFLNVKSISIMGKAGILHGGKGDLMIPSSHIFEGTADNYPFKNDFKVSDFKGQGLGVYDGSMVTVLGTSLQNKSILEYFKHSSWNAVGLEMEGLHYQKAIQAASLIRNSISTKVVVRYAYYASDNPLETGSTLASGALGETGVKPTYLITEKIIEKIIK